MSLRNWWAVAAAFLICWGTTARSDTLTLKEGTPVTDAWKFARVFVDSTSKMSFDSIRRNEFKGFEKPDHVPDFGFSGDRVWLRLTLKNESRSPRFVLTLDHIYLNQLDVYIETSTAGKFEKVDLGLNVPFGKSPREIEYYGFASELPIPVGAEREIYLSAKSNFPISFPLRIYERDDFSKDIRTLDQIFWFYIGVIVILIVYNLFIYLSVRDTAYLYYLLTLVSFHLFANLAQYGMVRVYFLSGNTWFQGKVFYFCHFFAMACLTTFVKKFIRLPETFPRASAVLNGFVVLSAGLFVAGLLSNTYRIDLNFQLSTTLYFFLLLGVAVMSALRGNRQAKFFSIAWSFLILSWVFNFLRIDGVVPRNLFTDHVVLLGAILEGTLLSLALADRLNLLRRQKEEAEREAAETAARGQIARQVAHDIRSPLTALEAVTSDLSGLPEGKRVLIRNAARRIKDIANDLIRREKNADGKGVANTLLSSLLEILLTEKRAQFRDRSGLIIDSHLTLDSYGIFARVEPGEFKRVFSNLIDNAAESIRSEQGEIHVSLGTRDAFGVLSIRDTGCGIPPEILSQLGHSVITYGKEGTDSGSGIGVYDAKNKLEAWGGSLRFVSHVGGGTLVEILLPLSSPPTWFVDSLFIKNEMEVVIVDDDLAIHELWRERLKDAKELCSTYYFTQPQTFLDWYEGRGATDNDPKAQLLLLDFEFIGTRTTGLELIQKHALRENAILVTSRFEDPELQQICANEKIRMLPKGLSAIVPIKTRSARKRVDLVLIDDDELVHQMWKNAAKGQGKLLDTFFSVEEFWRQKELYAVDCPIYIDSNLGNGVRGEVGAQSLYEVGYHNLYLATGYEASHFGEVKWVRAVISKEFPLGS